MRTRKIHVSVNFANGDIMLRQKGVKSASKVSSNDPVGGVSENTDTTKATNVIFCVPDQLIADAMGYALSSIGYAMSHFATIRDLLVRLNASEDPAVILIDLAAYGSRVSGELETIIQKARSAPVMIFERGLALSVISGAIDRGVKGIIPTNMPLRALPSVIELVSANQVYVPAQQSIKIVEMNANKEAVTGEEIGIIQRVSEGETNKEIAADLNITEVRVKMLIRSICKKLGARNRAHAAVLLYEEGVI